MDLEGMPPLDRFGGEPPSEIETDSGPGDRIYQDLRQNTKRDQLHPYIQTLTITDVESCVKLEEAAFPPNERCTREKVR